MENKSFFERKLKGSFCGLAVVLMAAMLVLAGCGGDSSEKDFRAGLNNYTGTVYIKSYIGKGGKVKIPKLMMGSHPVDMIGDGAFQNCATVKAVTIPDTVWYIGKEAFDGCSLTSVVIPNSVTQIGRMAFYNNQLTNVVIPNSVTHIGDGAFSSTVGEWGDYKYSNSFSISLPANVEFLKGMKDSLMDFYNKNGKQAGTYTYSGGNWSFAV